MKMKDRVAIVTGVSSGMGEAVAKAFLDEGAKVVGVARRENCSINHHNFEYVRGDISTFEDCKKVVEVTVEKFGKVDSLVNSAGISIQGTLETLEVDTFKQVYETNVQGTFNICKAAISELKKQPSTIVNISSNMGIKPLKNYSAYNPSKAAVNMLTECIALDYAPMVRANTVLPGLVDTPMIKERFDEAEDRDALMNFYNSLYPLARIGNVDDIVKSVLFLSTDESSWITGAHIPCCGGDQM